MKVVIISMMVVLASVATQAQFYPLISGQKIQSKKGIASTAYTEFGEAVLDSAGNIYVVGTFVDTLFPNPASTSVKLVAKNSEDIYLAKYSATGSFVWAKSFGSGYGLDLALDRLGNIYVTGYSNSVTNADFDPGVGTSLHTAANAFTFIAKYDNNGNYINAKFFNGNGVKGYGIAVDSLFNIYFTGTLVSQVDFDPGPGTFYLSKSTIDNRNGFYAKYDSNINFLWAKVDFRVRDCEDVVVHNATGRVLIASSGESITCRIVDFNGASTDSLTSAADGNSVRFDNAGNIYCSGVFAGTNVNFNWNGNNTLSTASSTTEEGFLVKYNASKVFQWVQKYSISFLNSSFDAGRYEMNIDKDGNPLLSFFESDGIKPNRGFFKVSANTGLKSGNEALFDTNTGGNFNNCSVLSNSINNQLVFVSNAGFSNNPASTIDINPDTAASSPIVNLVDDGIWSFIAFYGNCTFAPATPSSIIGNASTCSSSLQTYSVPKVNGATSYTWILPNGWIGASDSNSIIVTPTLGNGIISVSANNLCGTSSPRTLNVSNTSAPNISINASSNSVCAGSSVTLSGVGGSNYQWSNGVANGVAFTPIATNTYTVTGTDNGCTDTASIVITINNPVNTQLNKAICAGSSFTFNGNILTQSGTYKDTLQTLSGCDSIITLNLTVASILQGTLNQTICTGKTIPFNGQTLSQGGTYKDTVQTVSGCDSIITLNLTVAPILQGTLNQTICTGKTYTFNGQTLSQGGTYKDTVQTASGCDSIITLNLTVASILQSAFNKTICTGKTFSFNGQILSQGGTYKDTVQTASGCDSIITLNLTVAPILQGSFNQTICFGESYSFNNQGQTKSGIYKDTVQTLAGCDSIVTLNLFVSELIQTDISDTICEGDTLVFNNKVFTIDGFYGDTLTSAKGCDSLVTLNLFVAPVPYSSIVQLGDTLMLQLVYSAYQWFRDGVEIPNATSQKLFINQNGTYKVKAYNDYGCEGESVIFVFNLSTQDVKYSEMQLLVYPNPADAILNIEITAPPSIIPSYFEITDMQGRVVMSSMFEGKTTVDISKLAATTYQIKVSNPNYRIVKRFVKL